MGTVDQRGDVRDGLSGFGRELPLRRGALAASYEGVGQPANRLAWRGENRRGPGRWCSPQVRDGHCAEDRGGLRKAVTGLNRVEDHRGRRKRPQPLQVTADSPTRLIGAHDRARANRLAQRVAGRRGFQPLAEALRFLELATRAVDLSIEIRQRGRLVRLRGFGVVFAHAPVMPESVREYKWEPARLTSYHSGWADE
jgi:hypothetical protein